MLMFSFWEARVYIFKYAIDTKVEIYVKGKFYHVITLAQHSLLINLTASEVQLSRSCEDKESISNSLS